MGKSEAPAPGIGSQQLQYIYEDFDEDGVPSVCVAMAISQLEHYEMALAKSQEKFASMDKALQERDAIIASLKAKGPQGVVAE